MMSDYKFSHSWFLGSEISTLACQYLRNDKPNRLLEIGCFEGLSSVFFADNFLDHPESKMVCVDPFLKLESNDHAPFMSRIEGSSSVVEDNFDFNIARCRNASKISVHKVTSDRFFATLEPEETFSFIYVDGSHEPECVRRDLVHSFAALGIEGILWMDDYLGGDGVGIKGAMDTFLAAHQGRFEVIHSGYQLAIRRLS